jgi:hypothetical protein
VRILSGNGTSQDPQAYNEMVAKHPQNVPKAEFQSDYVPPELSEPKQMYISAEQKWSLFLGCREASFSLFSGKRH